MKISSLLMAIFTSLFFLCFSSIIVFIATQQQVFPSPWIFSLLTLSLLSLSPFLFTHWLTPGGFAWRNHRITSLNLRGPAGWPLLGSLPQMGPVAHRKLAAMAASFGAKNLMALSLGPTRLIISSKPETAREILSSSAFSDRPIKASARLMMFERAIGFAPAGEYWRRLRRIAANYMFSPRKIASLEPLRLRLAEEMAAEVGEEMRKYGTVKLRGVLQKSSLRNMLKSLFGMASEMEEFGSIVKEGYELISTYNLEDYFGVGFLDFNGVKRRCSELAGRVRKVVGGIVEERRRSGGGGNDDFLSVLLALPDGDRLSDSDIIAVLWEMIFRGTDTVAILLEWIMARMVIHEDVQAQIQREVDTCVGGHRHVQDSDIPNLRYLQAAVKEVLRIHPPGPLLSWARLAIHDVHVGKTLVPAGTTAMVNMWAITHDPSIWNDPWAFRPERFMEEDVSIMGSDLRLAPFGSGRRVCPGRALGLGTVHLWLAQLLQRYQWSPAAQPVDLSETLQLSMELKEPLTCLARRRSGMQA